MKRIRALTPDQIARFPEWVEKWIAIGLCTDPADFDKAERAVHACYQVAAQPMPRVVLRMGSPLGATLGGMYAALILGRSTPVESPVWSSLESSIEAQVAAAVWAPVWAQVQAPVRAAVAAAVEAPVQAAAVAGPVQAQVWAQVWSPITGQVWAPIAASIAAQVAAPVAASVAAAVQAAVWAPVRAPVRAQVEAPVAAAVEAPIAAPVAAQVQAQVAAQVGSAVTQYRGCQLWAGWYAYITYFRDVCGWDDPTLLAFSYDEALSLSCGWTWWHDLVCAVSDRPHTIRRNARGQLHCVTGPAISYRDGWSLWCWHGVCVTEQIIAAPETLTKAQIAHEPNAQVRQVMVERLGIERVCRMFDATVLDRRGDYALLNLDLGDGRRRPYLKMRNPSEGVYHIEGVHPRCKTVQQAINWRAGDDAKNWHPTILT